MPSPNAASALRLKYFPNCDFTYFVDPHPFFQVLNGFFQFNTVDCCPQQGISLYFPKFAAGIHSLMAITALDHTLRFPPVSLAEPDGLLAFGGDLSKERLLLAYRKGIFPWYEEEPVLWWSPDPRFVLFPSELRISRSMKQVLRRDTFSFSVDKDFRAVIGHCKTIGRRGQESTWITDEIKAAYTSLHEEGYAHSAEARLNGELVGGLYGVRLGRVFFGESMFSLVANASKYAFIRYVLQLQAEGIILVDCQVYTEHLESLGARMIPRSEFIDLVEKHSR
jgi:leucyl/phenylalanyl-tRNA--protein transferase